LGQTKLEKIVMAETTRRPVTGTEEEFSKGGERSVLTFGIVATGLILLLVLFGLDAFNLGGSKQMAPNAPQPVTEPPATSGSQSQ
jgi:cytochrome c-type biogenesis protein CcmH/NrfG